MPVLVTFIVFFDKKVFSSFDVFVARRIHLAVRKEYKQLHQFPHTSKSRPIHEYLLLFSEIEVNAMANYPFDTYEVIGEDHVL